MDKREPECVAYTRCYVKLDSAYVSVNLSNLNRFKNNFYSMNK